MAVFSVQDLWNAVAALLVNNTTGDIEADEFRARLRDILDSSLNISALEDGDIPMKDGSPSGLRVLNPGASNETVLMPQRMMTEHAGLMLSSSAVLTNIVSLLNIRNNLTGDNWRVVDYQANRDEAAKPPSWFATARGESSSTEIHPNGSAQFPLSSGVDFEFTPGFTGIIWELEFNVDLAIDNLRLRVVEVDSDVAVVHWPSIAAWETGTGGTDVTSTGLYQVDLDPTPLFDATPTLNYRIEMRGDSGRITGVGSTPYLGIFRQVGPRTVLANRGCDNYLGTLGGASATHQTWPAAHRGDYVITTVNANIAGRTVVPNQHYRCTADDNAAGDSANWERVAFPRPAESASVGDFTIADANKQLAPSNLRQGGGIIFLEREDNVTILDDQTNSTDITSTGALTNWTWTADRDYDITAVGPYAAAISGESNVRFRITSIRDVTNSTNIWVNPNNDVFTSDGTGGAFRFFDLGQEITLRQGSEIRFSAIFTSATVYHSPVASGNNVSTAVTEVFETRVADQRDIQNLPTTLSLQDITDQHYNRYLGTIGASGETYSEFPAAVRNDIVQAGTNAGTVNGLGLLDGAMYRCTVDSTDGGDSDDWEIVPTQGVTPSELQDYHFNRYRGTIGETGSPTFTSFPSAVRNDIVQATASPGSVNVLVLESNAMYRCIVDETTGSDPGHWELVPGTGGGLNEEEVDARIEAAVEDVPEGAIPEIGANNDFRNSNLRILGGPVVNVRDAFTDDVREGVTYAAPVSTESSPPSYPHYDDEDQNIFQVYGTQSSQVQHDITGNGVSFGWRPNIAARILAVQFVYHTQSLNVRVRITEQSTGRAVGYFPSKEVWDAGAGGSDFPAGTHNIDADGYPNWTQIQPDTDYTVNIRGDSGEVTGWVDTNNDPLPVFRVRRQVSEQRILATVNDLGPDQTGTIANQTGRVFNLSANVRSVRLELSNFRFTQDTFLWLRMRRSGESAVESGASAYAWVRLQQRADVATGNTSSAGDNADDKLRLTSPIDATVAFDMEIKILGAHTPNRTSMFAKSFFQAPPGHRVNANADGALLINGAIDQIQIGADSGTMSGDFDLWENR